MKNVIFLFVSMILIACSPSPDHDPAKTVINPDIAVKKSQPTIKQETKVNSIVEENNACICTKEYAPVCGSDGNTYPSGCQAACAGIKDFTDGPCKK